MAKQNEQPSAESAPGTPDPPDGPGSAPVLRRRLPTPIPKLQGRLSLSPPAAAQPVVEPTPALPPADPEPAVPEPADRQKLLWISAAAVVVVVMIATVVVLSVGLRGSRGKSNAAAPAPAASGAALEEGIGAVPTSSAAGAPTGTGTATRTAASDPASADLSSPGPVSHSPKASQAATGLPNSSGVDLALHKPVTASGTEGPNWAAANAVDGDPATRWSSAFADPQWIKIDLGALRQVGQVRLTWQDSYAVAFQVQTSADGATWKSVYSTSSGQGGTQTIKLNNAAGRYLRVYGTERVTNYGYSLFEIDVR